MNIQNSYIYRITVTILLATLGIISGVNGQDPQFSQYYSAGAYLNPAMVGLESKTSISLNHREQKLGVDHPFILSQVSFVQPINFADEKSKQTGGVGLSVYNDISGVSGYLRKTGMMISAAYNARINVQSTLTFGIQGNHTQKVVDFNKLEWGSQYNPERGYDQSMQSSYSGVVDKTGFTSFNAGAIFEFQPVTDPKKGPTSWYVGLTGSNLNVPDESLVSDIGNLKVPALLKFHAGLSKVVKQKINIQPSVLVMKQRTAYQINVGSYLSWKLNNYAQVNKDIELDAGLWYRLNDSFILGAGGSYQGFTLALSYDLNTTSLQYDVPADGGTMEISLKYTFQRKSGGVRRNKNGTIKKKRRSMPRF